MDIFQETASVPQATLIGAIAWWSLPGNLVIDRQELESAALQHGIPSEYLPQAIGRIGALKRAIASKKIGIEKSHSVTFAKLIDDKNTLQYGVLAMNIVDTNSEGKKAVYRQIGKLSLDKNDESAFPSWTVEKYSPQGVEYDRRDLDIATNTIADVQEVIDDHFDLCLSHNTDDLRGICLRFMNEKAISLRDRGGIYFVSASYLDELKDLRDFVQSFATADGKASRLLIKNEWVVTPEDLEAFRAQGMSEMEKELQELSGKHQSLIADMDDAIARGENHKTLHGKKVNSLASSLADFNLMKQRVAEFSGILQFHQDSYVSNLAEMVSTLKQRLDRLGIDANASIDWAFDWLDGDGDRQQQTSPPSPPPSPNPPAKPQVAGFDWMEEEEVPAASNGNGNKPPLIGGYTFNRIPTIGRAAAAN